MAYFRCSLGGGSGNGAVITVAYGADFYNQTFVATNNVDTVSVVATSSGTVDIDVPSEGSWVISCTIGADTYTSDPVLVELSYEATITAIPDGSTVLPTDDIETWLECAGITDKAYTTLAEVLADTDTYTTLLGDSNACDYMARSTTWASTIVADADAMRLLGMYDYACDALLSDSTWRTAILGSTYWESILDVAVPAMTSNTTPSGVASFKSGATSTAREAWRAFDKALNHSDSTLAASNLTMETTDDYIQYVFDASCKIYKGQIVWWNNASGREQVFKNIMVDVSSDGSTFTEVYRSAIAQGTTTYSFTNTNPTDGTYIRCHMIGGRWGGGDERMCIDQLYFYGRHTAQTDIIVSAPSDTIYYLDNGSPVTLCTTDTDGIGSVDWSDLPTGDITLYSSVAKDPSDLTADYSKSIKVTKNKVEGYLMPDTALYWWGYMANNCQDCTSANGWTKDVSTYTLNTPTHNTNDVYLSSTAVSAGVIGTTQSIASGKTVKYIASCNFSTRMYRTTSSKNIYLSQSISEDNTTSLKTRSYTLTDTYPNVCIGIDSGTRNVTVNAFWLE